VASEVEGKVIAFGVRRGEAVEENGILARIDPRALSIDLEFARAQLMEAQKNYENANLELQRSEKLIRQKSISSREYDDVRFQAAALESRIRALRSRIEAIRYDLERCTVRAPFSGFVVAEHTEVGQWAKKGGAIAEIADLDPIVVTVPVPDRYVRFMEPKQKLRVLFHALGQEATVEGTVRALVPEGNENARTFPLEILVPNAENRLLAGMSCEVQFPVGPERDQNLVHKDAVVAGGDTFHVFAVREGKAVLVPVEKGQAYDGSVVVQGDLREGETIVVEGNERLQPGQAVEIIHQEAAEENKGIKE
jgi:RND family efflux transporter MFP subunit